MMSFKVNFGEVVAVTGLLASLSGCCGAVARDAAAPAAEHAESQGGVEEYGTEMVKRDVLFGNPDKAAVRISPDGLQMSFLAPVDGVLNVWVGPAEDPSAARPVTEDRKRGIRAYFWAYTSRHIVYLQDKDGDENWHVYSVDLTGDKALDLTPYPAVHATIEGVSHKFPETILVGLNNRDPALHDIYKINIETGEQEQVIENPGFLGFVTDDDYRVRFAMKMTEDGGNEVLAQDEAGEWKTFMEIGMEDSLTTSPVDFDETGRVLYMLDSRGRDTAALTALNLDTGKNELIAEDPRADLDDLMMHPIHKKLEAVAFTYLRKQWKVLDSAVAEDFEVLRQVKDGDFEVTSRTLDDRYWIVAYLVDDGPIRYYHYDRETKEARFLFTNRAELEGKPLVHMLPLIIESRDGLKLVSYLSLPPDSEPDGDGRPVKPVPLVLNVHGGPWARDEWGFDATHQWLANRGYAVLSVNFRGSTGFGKAFINAGNMEWAGKMHDDLLDAVSWAVSEKITTPDKVAIFGGSYGGYATLIGLTFTPLTFACGVDIVGPSNLMTLLQSIPPYWKPMIELFTKRVGDHRTDTGKALLKERSPLYRADKITKPLLIAQGANDPRVKQAESDQIVQAMKAKEIPVTYALYTDEGHGFARPENRLSFYAVTEIFLEECLGGRSEPFGKAFSGSSLTVPDGAEHIPGLSDALSRTK